MSAGHDGGPFRRDARVVHVVEALRRREAWTAIHRVQGPGLDLPGYLAVMAVATLLTTHALSPHALSGYLSGLGLLGLAAATWKMFRDARRRIEADPHLPTRCLLREDGVVLEGEAGRSFWTWAGMRSMREAPGMVVLYLAGEQVLALRAGGEDGARVARWIAARVPRAVLPPPRRTLLLLAVLYAMLCAAAVLVLPSVVPP